MSAESKPSWRILIGAGSFADAQAALRLVERFAVSRAAELGGMFLEEGFLAEISDLPKRNVITSWGGLAVAPTPRQIHSQIESDAKAFREMLSGVARSRKWTFERRRGELIGGLCAAAAGWDLLLVGYRELHRFPGQVILIAPPADAAQRAVGLANDLAGALKVGVRALTLSAGPAGPGAGAMDIERFDDESALLARLARIPASALVIDVSAGPLRSFDALRRVFAAARCPVVVLGAGRAQQATDRGE